MTDNAGPRRDRRGFYVSAGLLDPTHLTALGHAGLIVFLWFLSEQTDARGTVRCGAVIRRTDIATPLGMNLTVTFRAVQRLVACHYIAVEPVRGPGGGYRVTVNKPKAWIATKARIKTQGGIGAPSGLFISERVSERNSFGHVLTDLQTPITADPPVPRVRDQVQPVGSVVLTSIGNHASVDLVLTPPDVHVRPPRHQATTATMLVDRFQVLYEQTIKQPFVGVAGRDRSLMRRALQIYAAKPDPLDAVTMRIEAFWHEKARALRGDPKAHWMGRAKANVPGWFGQLTNLDEYFTFNDNGGRHDDGTVRT